MSKEKTIHGYIEEQTAVKLFRFSFPENDPDHYTRVKRARFLISALDGGCFAVLRDLPFHEDGAVPAFIDIHQYVGPHTSANTVALISNSKLLGVFNYDNVTSGIENEFVLEYEDFDIYDAIYFYIYSVGTLSVNSLVIDYETKKGPNSVVVFSRMDQAIDTLREQKIMDYDDGGGESPY